MTVRELLQGGAAWTQNTLARAADGTPVQWYSKVAASYCLLGAVIRTSHLSSGERFLSSRDQGGELWAELWRALARLRDAAGMPPIDLLTWQDTPGRTWEEIDALLTEAGE